MIEQDAIFWYNKMKTTNVIVYYWIILIIVM